MQLEVGKYYKTRDRKKAYISTVLSNQFNLSYTHFLGYVDDGKQRPYTWHLNGKSPADEGSYDIVEEWQDPIQEEGWVNIYSNPTEYMGLYKSYKDALKHACNGLISTIKVVG